MVWFVSSQAVGDPPVFAEYFDVEDGGAFNDVGYEADPSGLELVPLELEGIANGVGAMGNGYRVRGEFVPRSLVWDGGAGDVPDLIIKNHYVVSPRFRDLVESLEPGVHQFFPVAIYREVGGPVVSNHYWINICNRIDSVNRESTNLKWKIDYTGKTGFWDDFAVPDPRLVFSKDKVLGLHLWVDPFLLVRNSFYCSNEFANIVLERGFTGIGLTEQLEA